MRIRPCLDRRRAALLTLPLLFPALASSLAGDFDCKTTIQDVSFDLTALAGRHSVTITEHADPSIINSTYTIDPCKSLPKLKGIPPEHQCPSGTRVCLIQREIETIDDKSVTTYKVVPIAAHGSSAIGSKPLDPVRTILTKDTHGKDGLRVVMHGGLFPLHGDKKEQKEQRATVDFICDKGYSGDEGNEEQPVAEARGLRVMEEEQPKNMSLTFVSYALVEKEDVMELRLDWRTKWACKDAVKDSPEGGSTGGWGFFTWLIIIVFLGASAYLIFGSWLNYNRYGARGWDLLPHSDAIRDVPYLLRDFARRIASLFANGGSRGGYSAV